MISSSEWSPLSALIRSSVQPFPDRQWGFSLTEPGLGPLDKSSTRVAKAIWDFRGATTSSRHIGDVEFIGRPHCGVLGTAPSHDLLAKWRARESDLADRHKPVGFNFAALPTEVGAYVGQEMDEGLRKRIYTDGARTKPAREVSCECSALMAAWRQH